MYSRHIFLTLALALAFFGGRAQTFHMLQAGSVPNDSAWHYFAIPVSGVAQPALSTAYGLTSACISITHPDAAALHVRLLGPDSAGITLADLIGNRTAGFTNTCFTMVAGRSIANGLAPFTGFFLPEQFYSFFNQGRASNGLWHLAVKNESPTDLAIVNSASIRLEANPAPDPLNPRLCGMQNPAGCDCPDGSDTCDLLPDMLASAMVIERQHSIGTDSIRLSNGTPNVGWGPLEIHGTQQCYCDTVRVPCSQAACPDGSAPREKVIQRVYRREGTRMVTRDVPVGYMSYHSNHGHVHVVGWASFSLRINNGNPSPRHWPVVASGGKTSYCLVNTGSCTATNGYCKDANGTVRTEANIRNFGFGTITGCQRSQGIFTGSLDVYSQGMAGQTIPLAGVCSGDYYIVSETDPDNYFLETNDTNNIVAVPVRLNRPNAGVMPSFQITQIGQLYAFAATNIPQGSRYVWDFGDGTLDSTSNPVIHMYQGTGNYTVTLTYKGQTCGNTVSTQYIVITSVPKTLSAGSFDLKVQPNPLTDQSVIRFNLPVAEGASLQVVNALGQRVRAYGQGQIRSGINSLKLEGRLAPGLYTAVLETRLGRTSAKFAVE